MPVPARSARRICCSAFGRPVSASKSRQTSRVRMLDDLNGDWRKFARAELNPELMHPSIHARRERKIHLIALTQRIHAEELGGAYRFVVDARLKISGSRELVENEFDDAAF